MIKVSIQGELNSFHDIAAKKFFKRPTIICCESFRETVGQLTKNEAEYAVVAIENSLYGTINKVYDLILSNKVYVVGEVFLRIEQNLIGTNDAELSDIEEIHSHPVALAQCEYFLDHKLPNALRFEHHDTAGSVLDIKKWNDKKKAAIASKEAAISNGMKILAKSIETNKQNYTRFVVLSKKLLKNNSCNKTSLVIQTPEDNKAGSLVNILKIFSNHNINLTALHSRPVIGKAWHYMFYIDIEINFDSDVYKIVMENLNNMKCNISILGNYVNGLQ